MPRSLPAASTAAGASRSISSARRRGPGVRREAVRVIQRLVLGDERARHAVRPERGGGVAPGGPDQHGGEPAAAAPA